VIELRGATVRVGAKTLLSRVDLQFSAGTLVAIVGPNGAGKSTLVRVAAGALEPTRGEVFYGDAPLRALSPAERAQRRAVMSQRSEIAFGFTAYEVVLLGRLPHAPFAESRFDHECARAALYQVDGATCAERVVTTLSGGERQRIDLARALAQTMTDCPPEGRALLLDEPTSSLDLSHQHAMLSLLGSVSRQGSLVVVVLHDLNLAAQNADRIVVLKDARVVADGAPHSVFTTTLVQSVFGLVAQVLPHPELDCPLIVSGRAAGRFSDQFACASFD
jgi:iron complex transport system ATP-binding protein